MAAKNMPDTQAWEDLSARWGVMKTWEIHLLAQYSFAMHDEMEGELDRLERENATLKERMRRAGLVVNG